MQQRNLTKRQFNQALGKTRMQRNGRAVRGAYRLLVHKAENVSALAVELGISRQAIYQAATRLFSLSQASGARGS